MNLIIGGAYQGKLEYAKNKYSVQENEIKDGASCELLQSDNHCKIMNHFHLYIKRLIEAKIDVNEAMDEFLEKNKKIILICNELGCGLVPVTKEDRIYREIVGRALCKVAKVADSVTRVYCGIGEQIK